MATNGEGKEMVQFLGPVQAATASYPRNNPYAARLSPGQTAISTPTGMNQRKRPISFHKRTNGELVSQFGVRRPHGTTKDRYSRLGLLLFSAPALVFPRVPPYIGLVAHDSSRAHFW
jgi:hypothetical protein